MECLSDRSDILDKHQLSGNRNPIAAVMDRCSINSVPPAVPRQSRHRHDRGLALAAFSISCFFHPRKRAILWYAGTPIFVCRAVILWGQYMAQGAKSYVLQHISVLDCILYSLIHLLIEFSGPAPFAVEQSGRHRASGDCISLLNRDISSCYPIFWDTFQ